MWFTNSAPLIFGYVSLGVSLPDALAQRLEPPPSACRPGSSN